MCVRTGVHSSLPEHIEVGVRSDTVERRWRGVSARTFISWHHAKADTSHNLVLLYNNPFLLMKSF